MTHPDRPADAQADRQALIDAEAADWLVRSSGSPLSARERDCFDQWLAASADHSKAFNLARKAWALMGDVYLDSKQARTSSHWHTPVSLAAAIAIAAVGASLYRAIPWFAIGADHYAPVGTVLPLTLPDGSVATLDSRSAVSITYDEQVRRIRLLRGSVHVEVEAVPNPQSRPFVVEAARGTVRALGTRFIVSVEDEAATVQVLEHSVLVTPHDAKRDGLVLKEGQQTRFTAGGSIDHPRATAPEPASWVRGHLVFDHTDVGSALTDINRYRKTPVIVLGAALEARNISGMFRIDDLDGAGQLLARELNARAVEIPFVGTVLY